MHLNMMPKYVL